MQERQQQTADTSRTPPSAFLGFLRHSNLIAQCTGRFVEQDISLFEQSMQLIYFGSLHVAKATLPAMVSRRKGQILFVVSPLAALGELTILKTCTPNAVSKIKDKQSICEETIGSTKS